MIMNGVASDSMGRRIDTVGTVVIFVMIGEGTIRMGGTGTAMSIG